MRLIDENYLSAGSTDTPKSVLEYLSNHHSPSIRARIAENPATPLHILERLAQDNCSNVRESVALNQKIPLDLLSDLVNDENPDVRFSIADNSHAPWIALCWLTMDDNPYVSDRAEKTIRSIKRMLCSDLKSIGAQKPGQLTFALV